MTGGSSSGGDAGPEREEGVGPVESDTVVVDGFSIFASRGEIEPAAQLADRLPRGPEVVEGAAEEDAAAPSNAAQGAARPAHAASVGRRGRTSSSSRTPPPLTKPEEALSAATTACGDESTDDDSLDNGDGRGCGREVVGREGAASVKQKMTVCMELSSEEEEEESTLEFDKSTDLVLSLNDEAYGSVVRPHFQQLWEDRGGVGEGPRDRSKGIFDVFRKKLKSTGGSFYKARNPNLKGKSFYDYSNLYLVEDEDEVVMKIAQDLKDGKRAHGKKAQQDAGNRSNPLLSSEVDNYKVLLPTDADARFERSIDVVLSPRDNTYLKILEPHLKAFWEERGGNPSEGATSRARRAFATLEEELQKSGGGFYKARNPKAAGVGFWKADNLYLVTDEEARKKIARDISRAKETYPNLKRLASSADTIKERTQSPPCIANNAKPSASASGKTISGKKRGAKQRHASRDKPTKSQPRSKRSRPDNKEDAKRRMADFIRATIARETKLGKSVKVDRIRRDLEDEWYIIQPGLTRKDPAAVEGVNMFTGDQAILDECFRRGIYRTYVIDTPDGKSALERAGIQDNPYSIISKSVVKTSKGKRSGKQIAGATATATSVSPNKPQAEAAQRPMEFAGDLPMDHLAKLSDLCEGIDSKLSKALSYVRMNTPDVFAELQVEYYEALLSLLANKAGSSIDLQKILQSMELFEDTISRFSRSAKGANVKTIYGTILQQLAGKVKNLFE